METNYTVQREIETYKEMMRNIDFMEEYLVEPEIFNPDSASFKNFLIKSFCHLYPDFHYLSFLSKEDVDHEIVKVASILQVLPKNTKKVVKLFDSMSKDDIHNFWLKFFTLFKNQSEFSSNSTFKFSWENKINLFKSMASTLNYLNYEFPIVDNKKFNYINVSEEITSWKKQVKDYIALDKSVSFISSEEQPIYLDVDKLISDIKQFVLICSNQKMVYQLNKSEYLDFFNIFINCTKTILEYKKNLSIINSIFLDEINFFMFSNNEDLTESLFFIRRCNNYGKTLRSKIKAFQ